MNGWSGCSPSGPIYPLRTAQALLRLAERHGGERLEAACARCLTYDELSYAAVKRILTKTLDKQPEGLPEVFPPLQNPVFARSFADFFPSTSPGGEGA